MVGMNDSGQRDRFLVDMKSGGVQVSMGTGYCGNNRKLGEVSYGRETWGSVSFSEHRAASQTPGIPLTHVVRMGTAPAAGLNPPSRADPDPLRAWLWDCALGSFLREDPPLTD